VSFPIVLSNGPPLNGKAPSGRNGLAEVAAAGVTHIRTGRGDWSATQIASQVAAERSTLDALQTHGLHSWCWLGELPNLPEDPTSPRSQLLARVADGLGGHGALGFYKGIDEPRNPFRGANWIRPAGMIRAYQQLRRIDPAHPVVIIQAPIGTVAQLSPYQPSFDITGADVYPVSYPPGTHTQSKNTDISVVGDVTTKMVRAAGGKPVWMTLQIAWSGVLPPNHVPRLPTLHEERFMAYQAIVRGARGLVFFGGHLTQIASPADAAAGWNWTFWQEVLRPLADELGSAALAPALAAPDAQVAVKASVSGVDLVARKAAGALYVIAVRRGGTVSRVRFSGLPTVKSGAVLFEYEQQPPPPPIQAGHQVFRPLSVSGGAFTDWLAPHDARVYRFEL
jgi:hypothetical protein